jgi:hypothetical protein
VGEVVVSAEMLRLTEEERESIVCDCAVALAVDACPIHSGDNGLWSEQPASHIIAAVERIISARLAAFADDLDAAVTGRDE